MQIITKLILKAVTMAAAFDCALLHRIMKNLPLSCHCLEVRCPSENAISNNSNCEFKQTRPNFPMSPYPRHPPPNFPPQTIFVHHVSLNNISELNGNLRIFLLIGQFQTANERDRLEWALVHKLAIYRLDTFFSRWEIFVQFILPFAIANGLKGMVKSFSTVPQHKVK